MLKEIVLFAIKAAIAIAMIMVAVFLLNLWGVIDTGTNPSRREIEAVDRERRENVGEAKEAIAIIWAASRDYHAEKGSWPTDIHQLNDLHIRPVTRKKWTFDIAVRGEEIRSIRATSTDLMPGGAGKQVVFDAQLGRWCGYGIE